VSSVWSRMEFSQPRLSDVVPRSEFSIRFREWKLDEVRKVLPRRDNEIDVDRRRRTSCSADGDFMTEAFYRSRRFKCPDTFDAAVSK